MLARILVFIPIILPLILCGQSKEWTLRECIDYAVENNLNIEMAEKDIRSSEVNIKDADGARLPNVSANASHVLNIGLSQNLTTGILEDQSTQFSSAGISLGWTVYNGKRNLLNQYRANASLLSNQYRLDNLKDNIRIQVANAYLQVLFARENIAILQAQRDNLDIDITRVQRLIEGGNLPEGEILELEASAAAQDQSIITAQNNLRMAKITLAQLLQLEDVEFFDIAEEDYDIVDQEILAQNPSAIYMKSLQNRFDIRAADTDIEIAKLDQEIAERAQYPTLSFFYNYDTRISYQDQITGFELNPTQPTQDIGVVEATGQSVVAPNFKSVVGAPDPFFQQWGRNDGHTLGLSLSVPIFQGYSLKNNIERQSINIDRRKIALNQTKQELQNAVYQAYYDALNAQENYQAVQKTLKTREKAFEFMKKSYEAGRSNAFEYNQSRQRIVELESQLLQAKYDYLFRLKVLEFYFGLPMAGE